MQAPLGSYLRQLRCARGLSQAQAARMAGIARVTLNRWENNIRQPHTSDLESLFRSLAATPQEQRHAFTLLNTASARMQTRDVLLRLGKQSGIGAKPEMGDFLRALRMRTGISQQEAAEQIGVAARTLRRWEKSEVRPSLPQLHSLCDIFNAQTEEKLALAKGQFASALETPEDFTISPHELWLKGHQLFFYTTLQQRQSLKDLSFFLLEIQAWPQALRSEAGRTALSRIYGLHAAYLSYYQRWKESNFYAAKSLDLLPSNAPPDEVRLLAGMAAARAAVYGGEHLSPKRGLELLDHWQGSGRWISGVKWPTYRAWLLSDMAEYLVLGGEIEQGLALVQQARDLAAECENPSELAHRQLNMAQLFVWAGRPEQALSLTEKHDSRLTAQFQLVEAEAFLNLSEPGRAQTRLQEAVQTIETYFLTHLRSQAQRLQSRLTNDL